MNSYTLSSLCNNFSCLEHFVAPKILVGIAEFLSNFVKKYEYLGATKAPVFATQVKSNQFGFHSSKLKKAYS